ncbi:MAG: undecaprenyl/decaprenyl-phosphate alpha-N-acetylglucosaminyl 1-phosphate transferase [Proteobacteria bacterium]|nr:undecaprenyl/decaprenyl-phosphate alpha-N-acetylglucosaminyl 1-phosphate transferase [Pseudomonadota bacterium]
MFPVVAAFCALSALMTAAICMNAHAFGAATHLIDEPDQVRKLHTTATPLIGGLAVLVPSLLLSLTYTLNIKADPFLMTAILASGVMLAVGVIDDRLNLSASWRILALTIIVLAVTALEPLFILHTLRFHIMRVDFDVPLEPFAVPLTALMIVGFVNASNMADGMNGQLLGSVIIWSLFIVLHIGAGGNLPYLILICSCIVALFFNLRGQIFSGSAGAYAASLFIALGAIAAYRKAWGALPAETPVFWFWLPVLDCLRLFASRPLKRQSPFRGDRNHFHHVLLDLVPARFALAIYLALLAIPGVAWEIDARSGKFALLGCVAIYALLIATNELRHWIAGNRTPSGPPNAAPQRIARS